MRKATDDPVVEEVRAIRSKIWREAGQTFDGLIAWLDKHVPTTTAKRPPKRRAKRPPVRR